MILGFGRYKGLDIDDVPIDYLLWLERTKAFELEAVRDALRSRNTPPPPEDIDELL